MKNSELILQEDCSVLKAMEQLDKAGRRVLFYAPQNKLLAVLTDGDIRRHLLRGGNLDVPVSSVANQTPKSLPLSRKSAARQFMQDEDVDALPLLDENGTIVEIAFATQVKGYTPCSKLNVPVVVMAGGQGTRLYPYTKILPKPLIPVGEVPILELLMERFYRCGCRDFSLIVNYKKNMIKSYFADIEKDWNLYFADEEQPLGTGGGLSLLKNRLNETFFFTNCDILIDADYSEMLRFHKKQNNVVTMICAAKRFVVPYGVVEADDDGLFRCMREKPQMNYLTNTGLYIVEPSVVAQMEDGKKQGFPDVIEGCRLRGERVGVYPVSENSWMDMGQLEELESMRRQLEEGQ